MWTTFTIALLLTALMGYLFFTSSRPKPRVFEGLLALSGLFICLAIAPLPIKIAIIIGVFILEQFRVRWEADESLNPKEHS